VKLVRKEGKSNAPCDDLLIGRDVFNYSLVLLQLLPLFLLFTAIITFRHFLYYCPVSSLHADPSLPACVAPLSACLESSCRSSLFMPNRFAAANDQAPCQPKCVGEKPADRRSQDVPCIFSPQDLVRRRRDVYYSYTGWPKDAPSRSGSTIEHSNVR
jgi:hypothetical protein